MKTIKITERSQITKDMMNKKCVMFVYRKGKGVSICVGNIGWHKFKDDKYSQSFITKSLHKQGLKDRDSKDKNYKQYTLILHHHIYNYRGYVYLFIFPEDDGTIDDCIESAKSMKVGMIL